MNIKQNRCNIKYRIPFPDVDIVRTGVVEGNNVSISGPLVIPFMGAISFTQNIFTAEGPISGSGSKIVLIGRQGNCSHDDRSRDLLGCWGNTFEAAVSITKVNVSGQKVTVTYDGKYNRDKFDKPCVKTANEQKRVFGTYQFELKPGRIVWGSPANIGEVSDASHDSNKYAFCAAQNAVNSAMQ